MFQLVRCIAIVALIISICGSASAQSSDINSANNIMPGCRKGLQGASIGYLEGLCQGTIQTSLYFSVQLGICAPAGVNVGQFMRVVVKYIDERPARMHEDFRALALEALRAAWPCKR